MDKNYYPAMDVKDIDDAVAVAREMLKDLMHWEYLEAAKNEKYGEQIRDALVIFIREANKNGRNKSCP